MKRASVSKVFLIVGALALAGVVGVGPAAGDASGVPTISFTRSPASPDGQNGWYTGNVDLAWHVDEGGATATTTGCVDQSFTVDGTSTVACSATNAFGSAGPVSVTVKRDATPPATSAYLSPAPPVGGWYRTTLPTLTISGDDGPGPGSGVAATFYAYGGSSNNQYSGPLSLKEMPVFCGTTFVLDWIGIVPDCFQGIHFWSADAAGNVESAKLITFKIATSPPDVDLRTPAADAVFAIGDDVVADYDCPDYNFFDTEGDNPPLPAASCVGTQADGTTIDTSAPRNGTFTVTATDYAGNTSQVKHDYSVVGDVTAPTIDSAVTGTLGNNGWYTSNVGLGWTVSEPESPASLVKTGCVDGTITADQAETSYSCSASSDGGSAAASVKIKRDATAPTLICSGADGLWHAANVARGCTGSDSGSGLAASANASFSLVTSVAAGTETPSAGTNSRSVCDNAGNCATAGPISGNRIDRRAPTITCIPVTFSLNEAPANVIAVAADGGSGPLSQIVAAPADTSSAGSKSLSLGAADSVGNTTTAVCPYVVTGAPPNTTITSHPPAATTSRSPRFSFTSTPAGATFQCSLDASAFASCTSPKAYSTQAVAAHTFRVRATNGGGTDASPATWAWTITAVPAPTLTTFTPSSGRTRSAITIMGTDLAGATSVKLGPTLAGSLPLPVATKTATQVVAYLWDYNTYVPSGKLWVTTTGGTAHSVGTYTISFGIGGLSPASGHAGASVVIGGKGFNGSTTAKYGTVAATITTRTATALTVKIPTAAPLGAATFSATNTTGVTGTVYSWGKFNKN